MLADFYRRLASIGRLILFDKRGTGLSDRVSPERLPDLETRMDDVRAVLDAVGSSRAVVLGISEGGAMSELFAATHPERTLALVLMGTFARMMRAPDYPIGLAEDDFRRRLAVLDEDSWVAAATEEWLARVAPTIPSDSAAVRWYRSYLARGASPSAGPGDPGHERGDRHPSGAPDDQRPDIGHPPVGRVLSRRDAIYGRAHSWCAARRTSGRRPPPLGR